MALSMPNCPECGREMAAFVPRRHWVCVYCGRYAPFVVPAGRAEAAPAQLPRRAPLGAEQDRPFTSWEQERFTPAERLALLRLKLDRDRLLLAECDPAAE